jgi:hypothetical protein
MTNLMGAISATVLALIFGIVAVSTALLTSDTGPATSAEVQVDAPCSSEACISPDEAEAATGFRALEPAVLPAGYVLYERSVPKNEIPPEARQRIAEVQGVPLSEVPLVAPANTVQLEYRFLGRPFVPAFNIVETRGEPGAPAAIRMSGEDCGEQIQVGNRTVFYGEGSGSVTRADDGAWTVCPGDGPGALANAVFLEGDVLIEVKVSLEYLSRSDALDLVRSM